MCGGHESATLLCVSLLLESSAPHTPTCTHFLGPQDNALAWERWTYVFAQERQLAALAPVLPTDEPRLKGSTYDMVLAALLLNPAGAPPPWGCVRRCTVGSVDEFSASSCAATATGIGAIFKAPSFPCNFVPPPEHEVLLDVVRRWPQSAYDAARLQAAVLE